MAKQRSGSPSGDNAGGRPTSDGWPSWMGDADPRLAPKQPPPAKAKAAPKPAAAVAAPRKAAQVQADPAPALAPVPARVKARPRIGLRVGIWAVVLVWAFVGGVIAARTQPDAAVRFQQATAGAQSWLGSVLPPAVGLAIAVGLPLTLFGLLVWHSGRPLRPRFLAFAFFVCLGTASIGMIRGGHDVDMERSAAAFRSKMHHLRQELAQWKQAAAKDRTLHQGLAALESKLQAAESDPAKSSMSIQEHEELVSALRKELKDLKKKLAEKD